MSSLNFTPNYNYLLTGSSSNLISLWDVKNAYALAFTLSGHTDKITSLDINKDKTLLISGSYDNTIKLWSLENFDLI